MKWGGDDQRVHEVCGGVIKGCMKWGEDDQRVHEVGGG